MMEDQSISNNSEGKLFEEGSRETTIFSILQCRSCLSISFGSHGEEENTLETTAE